MRVSRYYILFIFLILGFAESIAIAQNLALTVYDAEENEIGSLKLWQVQESQYIPLEDISKLFGGTRKNEPLFGRMTLILMEKKIVVTNEQSRVKINDEEVNISKPAMTISGKLAVPMDFLTKIISKVINKRMILNLDAQTLEITDDPFGSQGSYKSSLRKATYRIMIDPGHGGYDIGARSKSGLQEKILTLQVAQKIKEILSNREGIEVFLTRNDDKYMTLDERVKFANNLRGNVFLSIHFNASQSENSKGFSICVNNERMVAGTNSDTSMYYAQSKRLGNEIRAKLGRVITSGGKDKDAFLGVVNGLYMPSVIIEVLYLTNQDDLEILSKSNFTDSVATALSDSILAFARSAIADEGN